jgi:hypothetical protein
MIASMVQEALPVLPNGVYEITGSDTVHALLMLLNTADNAWIGAVVGIIATLFWSKRRKAAS